VAEFGHAQGILIRFNPFVGWGRLISPVLFVLLAPRVAAAFPSSRLVYARGPGVEGCPDQAEVRDSVKKRLGYDPFFPSSDKTIIVRVLREPSQLHGEVELVDEHGTQVGRREFSAPPEQCRELVRAMALSISIAIDPHSAETYGAGPTDVSSRGAAENGVEMPENVPLPGRGSIVPAEQANAPALSTAALPASSVPVPPAWRWAGGIGATLPLFSLPTRAPGAMGFALLGKDFWSLAIEGEIELPANVRLKGVELQSSSFALKAMPCGHWGPAFACQVTALRWLSATGNASRSSGRARSLSLGARLGAELPIGRSLGALAYADLLLSPTSVRLLSEGQELWRMPPLSGALGIALVVHFP
jgi:hypothetical protein